MTKTLLQSLKMEYENSDISLADLCLKHGVFADELTGADSWEKSEEYQPKPDDTPLIPEILPPTQPTSTEPQPTAEETPEDIALVLENIQVFKKSVVEYALDFIQSAHMAEVKEVKDVVAMVDSIEKSYKDLKPQQGPTINIAIQNLVSRFKDDC